MRTLSLLTPNLLGLGGTVGFLTGWEISAPETFLAWITLLAIWSVATLALDSAARKRTLRRLRLRQSSRFFWTGVSGASLAIAVAGVVAADHRYLMVAAIAGAALGAALRPVFGGALRVSRSLHGEALRWFLVIGVSALVISPYATRGLVGGGDAQHYVQQLADVLVQAEEDRFPFFVGRSIYAYNGDIHPLRTAPYFQYVGVLANFATGGVLGPAGVQNFVIVLSLLATGLLIYVLALRMGRRTLAWPASLLAVACVSGPGILSLIYSGDMVASWMTLPYLPPLIYGLLRLREETLPPTATLLRIAVCLAAVWLSHAPIAFWVSLLTLFFFAEFLLTRWESGKGLWLLIGAGVVSLVLAGYVFISVRTLHLPDDPNLIQYMRNGGMIHTLRGGWAGLFTPVDAGAANLLGNLKLSPVLWLGLMIGLIGAVGQRRVNLPLWVYFAGLLLLLTPFDFTARVWGAMPAVVIGATDKWPMQRFYPILSILVPFTALLGLRWRFFSVPRAQLIVCALLAAGCTYSLFESRKFLRRGHAVRSSIEFTQQRLRPENAMLSRYTYEYYGRLPTYFRHGPMAPLFQNRLLDRDTLEITASNLRSVVDQVPEITRGTTVHQFQKTDYGCRFTPKLRIEPGKTYVVNFDFGAKVPEGVLELTSPVIYRQYSLSPSMEPQAFREGGGQQRGFALWTSSPKSDEVELRFYVSPGQRLPAASGMQVKLIEVETKNLPLRLEELIPYRVSLTPKDPGWLGTPKIFVPGYVAFVDGKETPVARSPEGLVMVPVEQGSREVILRYHGPWILRVAFWVTAAGWLLVLAFLVLPKRGKLRVQERQAAWLILVGKAGAGAAIAVFLTAGIVFAFNRPPPLEKIAAHEQISLALTLPVGRENATETITSTRVDNREIALFARYVSGKEVVFGFLRDGQPWLTSAPTAVNYILPHDLDFVWGQPDPAHPDRKRFRVVVGHRVLIDRFVSMDAPPDPRSDRHPKTAPFSGEVHAAATVHAALPSKPSKEFPSIAAPP